MAHKRRIPTAGRTKEEEPPWNPSDDLPEKYQDMSWTTWFKKVYARAFFIVGCMWLDAMLWLSIHFDLGQSWELATLAIIVVILVEGYLFYHLWMRGRSNRIEKV